MNLQDKINLALESGRIEGAKKLLSMLVQQEHRAEWDKVKREEYELLFPAYYPLEQEFVFADDDMYKWKKAKEEDGFEITLFDTERQYAEYRKAIDYTDNVDYVTYDDWLNETKSILVDTVLKEDDNGTQYEEEIFEQEPVRPYIPQTDAEIDTEMNTWLDNSLEYKALRTKQKDEALKRVIVTTSTGKKFYGDAVSRVDISDAIGIAEDLALTTTTWKLATGLSEVTLDELKEARMLSLRAKGDIVGVQ